MKYTNATLKFVFALICMLTITSLRAQTNITTTIGSVNSSSCAVGDTLVLPIMVNMASGISTAAISMAIDYDTTKLRCISAVTGLSSNISAGFLSNCGFFSNQNPNPPYTASNRRQFRAAWFNLTPVSFNGLMFNLRFVVVATGNSSVKWDLATAGNCEYADELADVIPNCSFVDGSITCGSAAPVNCGITLSSASGTNSQSICQGSTITNITYATTAATGATVSGLPSGVTGVWASNAVTISGTPTVAGTFNYTVTLSGCTGGTSTATGTITVAAPASAGTLSGTQSICVNGTTTFTSTVSGGSWTSSAVGVATVNATTGVVTGVAAGNANITYTVTGTGGCANATATRTVTVNSNNTITLSSASGTNGQTVTVGTTITNITYSTTGATGATISGLPAGVTGSWASNVVTISGTPSATGTFNYTVTMTGGCTGGNNTATGSITVNPAGPNISTTIGSVSGCVGDTVTVPVTISMASGISTAAISMAIDYDSTKLRCISAVTGLNANITTGFLSNCGLFTSLNPNTPYNASTRRQFRAAWFNLTPVAFNGLMFNVRFVILASGSSPVIWDLSNPGNCEYADEVADVIPNTEWINGTIATGPNCCTATASISPAGPTTFCQGGSVTLNANTGTGLSYQWSINGSLITGASSASYVASTSGSYTVAVSSSPNCSANSSPVAVLVKNNSSATIEAAICQGQSYTFGSQSLTSAGTYNRTVTAANGCDSVITLILAIKPNASSNISEAICQGQSYTFGLQTLTTSGTYTNTVTAGNGCDSVVTLILTVLPNSSATVTDSICPNQTYLFGNQTISSTGTYTQTTPSANGCDSVITLNLLARVACSITTTIGSVSGCVGDTVLVPVTIQNGFGIASISMAIGYDPSKLACINGVANVNPAIANSLLTNCGTFNGISQFRAAWFDLNPVNLNGNLFTMKFVVLAPGTHALSWDLVTPGNCEYTDAAADIIPGTSWNNGNVTLGSGCCAVFASITPSGSTSICQGSSVTLNASSGTGLSYQWFLNGSAINGATNSSLVANSAGSYTVSVSESANCSYTSAAVSLTVNALPTATITAGGATTFCQGASVTLNANTGSGLSYQWLLNNAAISGATNASLVATAQGSYTVTVTNLNGCSATSSATSVTVRSLPIATITGATSFCQGANTVLSANTGTGRTYQWRRNNINIIGATSANYTVVTAGTYAVAVTSNTCVAISNAITVSVNPLPTVTVNAAGNTSFCQGNSVTLNATTDPSNTIQWRRNGTDIAGATSNTLTASDAGAYTARVTSSTGCAATSSAIQVTVGSTPNLIAQPQNRSVNLYDSVTFSVQANEATSYQWQVSTSGNASFVNLQDNQLYAGSRSTTLILRVLTLNINNYRFRCVVSNSCGQVNSNPASLTVNTPSAVQFYFDNQLACQSQNGSLVSIPVRANNFFRVAAINGKIKLPNGSSLISVSNVNSSLIGFASAILGSDTVSLSWFRNYGVTLSDSSVLFRINLTYNNSVNGNLSWISGTMFAFNEFNSILPVVGNNGVIISREIPLVNAGNDINSCPGATVVLSASGNASTFEWSNGSTGTNITVNPFNTTTYVVSGMNQFGCSISDTVVVYVNPVVPVQIANPDTVSSCSTGNGVQLLATGANSYIWTPSAGLNSSTIPNPTANPTTTTRYKVIGISASGCVTEDSILIIVYSPVSISFNLPSNSVCLNQTNITLNATPFGGTFTGNGVVNGTFSPSTAGPGNHVVTYTYIDQNSGCISQATQSISVDGLPNGSAGLDQLICQGQTTILSATGGSSYLWNNGNTSPFISVNPSQTTTYTVSIFNTSGCFVIDTIIVEVSTGPNITLSGNTTICSGGSTQITGSGGTSYSWSPNVGISSTAISNPIFNPQTTTTYTVYAANSNGCVSANTITIVVNELPIVNAGNDTISCGIPILISASSYSTGTVTYSWNTGATTQSIMVNPQISTNYVVTVTNSNGCSATDSITVFMPIAFAGSNQTICRGGSALLNANLFNAPNSIGNLIYSWTPLNGLSNSNSSNPVVTPASTTVYTVTITDPQSNCSFTSSVAVLVLPTPQVNLGSNFDIAPGNNVSLSASISNQLAGITYSWNLIGSGNGTLVAGIGPNASFTAGYFATISFQEIVLTVTNSNGCSGSDTLTITIDPSLGGYSINGFVQYANAISTPVNQGSVILRGPQGGIKSVNISPGGNFFINNVLDSAYTLITKVLKEWGGITVADAQLINDHATSAINLNGIYLKAADVTGDSQVLANDAQQTAKRAANLGIQYSFDSSRAGNWVDDTAQIILSGNHITQNLNVLSRGDVNGSYSPVLRQGTSLDLTSNLVRYIKSHEPRKQIISIYVNNNLSLGSYQFAFELPFGTKISEIKVPYSNGILTQNMLGNQAVIVWYKNTTEPLTLTSGSKLLAIEFEILDDKNKEISVSNFKHVEFNDPTAQSIPSIALRAELLKFVPKNLEIEIYPNPNQGSFVISSNSSKGILSLQIRSLSGQLIKEIRVSDILGCNNLQQLPMDLTELPSGQYLLNILHSSGNLQKKLVIKH